MQTLLTTEEAIISAEGIIGCPCMRMRYVYDDGECPDIKWNPKTRRDRKSIKQKTMGALQKKLLCVMAGKQLIEEEENLCR